ncbi:MAG: aminotransferase class V-fold PLP-dependent enzyme [Acidimicrobiales bacterium]
MTKPAPQSRAEADLLGPVHDHSGERHYLDHASSAPLRPEAARAITAWIEERHSGDPARVHVEGHVVRDAIERAREAVAVLWATTPSRVVFTSGGTEAANTAVFAAGAARPGAPMICANVEHSCVREAAERHGPVTVLGVDSLGRIDLDHLESLLAVRGGPSALVNCQWASHEVGTVQPVTEVVTLCRAAGVPVHIDASAALGHLRVELDALGADFVSTSGHKLGGPPGSGALYVKKGMRLAPFLIGGAQERARRAGAENVLGIVGLGAAAAALCETGRLETEEATAWRLTRALLEAATSLGGVEPLGDTVTRVPHIVNVAVGGVLAEAVLLGLDRAGIAAHSGSACSSESIEPSPVLAAMGVDPDRSLRLSVGWPSTDDDVAAFAAAFPAVVERLRALGSAKP